MIGQSVQWISIIDQYEPKSPWADKRVRLAASMAFNRQAVNEAEMLGYSVLTRNIIPRKMEYALPLEPYPYDPKRAKALLKEAGYPNGFDAGECSTENVYAPVVEKGPGERPGHGWDSSQGEGHRARGHDCGTGRKACQEPDASGEWRLRQCRHTYRGLHDPRGVGKPFLTVYLT